MNYTPNRENKYPEIIACGSMVIGLICYFLSRIDTPIRAILQASALLLFMLALFMMVRYSLTRYEYVLDDEGDFLVIRYSGKKQVIICNLNLGLGETVFEKQEYNFEKDTGKMRKIYNCCADLFPKKAYIFTFRFGHDKSAVVFQPNEAFVKKMNEAITSRKENQPIEL